MGTTDLTIQRIYQYGIGLLLIVGCISCGSRKDATKITAENKGKSSNAWSYQFDFDGDEKKDTIFYNYTGGANCCYQLSLRLSSTAVIETIPYEISGGYLFFDLSQPDNFSIYDIDADAMPEIFLKALSMDSIDYNKPASKMYVDFERPLENPTGYRTIITYKKIAVE